MLFTLLPNSYTPLKRLSLYNKHSPLFESLMLIKRNKLLP